MENQNLVAGSELEIQDLIEVTPEQRPSLPGIYKVYSVSTIKYPFETENNVAFRISLNHTENGQPMEILGMVGGNNDERKWKRINR